MQFAAIRPNLSAELLTVLRKMIVDGQLVGGERINEVHLAAKLGISRTPLREALSTLVAEGAVLVVPRSGFYACPLTVEELDQIYPIRAILDPAALRLAGIPSPQRIARIKAINRKIRQASDPEKIVALDDAWHFELLADCPNTILLSLIQQFVWRTRRYELALMREQKNVKASTEDHEAVLAALEAGSLSRACEALRKNMETGKVAIATWLEARDRTSRERKQ